MSHKKFGTLSFVYGTVVTSAVAMLIAVPLGVGTAVFLSEIATGWVRRIISFLVEMLAAIPSVVYGFWGLFVFAPVMQQFITAMGGPNTGGLGILSASLILSVMIVPYVTAVSFDVCQAVPRSQREGALSLGATRWQMIWGVVLPYARPGIVGACFLALGRALGETMAVTMLIGNKAIISGQIFSLGNTIASVIANEFTEADYNLYLSALTELALVLLAVSVVVNSLARILIWRVSRPGQRWSLLRWLGWRPGWMAGPPLAPIRLLPRPRRAAFVNNLMIAVLGGCVTLTVGPLFFIFSYLVYRGGSSLSWEFFVHTQKAVSEAGGGIAHALIGSGMLISLATLFAVPVGLFAAVYLSEFRRTRLASSTRFVGEMLGGVPSIVIGMFVYNLLVKPMGHFSGWAGAFALGVMMIPIVMRASEEALKLVPAPIRNASYALGATQRQTVLRVLIPAALPAIITGVFLAIARIGGETAPLLLTAGTNRFFPSSPNDFTPSVPYLIFAYATSPFEAWKRQASGRRPRVTGHGHVAQFRHPPGDRKTTDSG